MWFVKAPPTMLTIHTRLISEHPGYNKHIIVLHLKYLAQNVLRIDTDSSRYLHFIIQVAQLCIHLHLNLLKENFLGMICKNRKKWRSCVDKYV